MSFELENIRSSFFTWIVLIAFATHAINRDTLPDPLLESAKIEWWFPHYINPPKMHITLTTFEIGKIWNQLTDYNKREISRRYNAVKRELIDDQAKLLNDNLFLLLFPQDETYGFTGIDIIGTHPHFEGSYVLETSFLNPSGNSEKIKKFREFIDNKIAFENEFIQTIKGIKQVSKYRWFLVVKLDNHFLNFRNKICSNSLLNHFPQSTQYTYLPHITLGRLENIEEFDLFILLMQRINATLSPPSFELSTINRTISTELLQLKAQQQNVDFWLEANDDKIYFLSDSTKNNIIFMIVLGWSTTLGAFFIKLVNDLPKTEKAILDELEKSSMNSLMQLSMTLTSLTTK